MTDLKQKLESKLAICKELRPGKWFDYPFSEVRQNYGDTTIHVAKTAIANAEGEANARFIAATRDGNADYEQVLSCCLIMLEALEKIQKLSYPFAMDELDDHKELLRRAQYTLDTARGTARQTIAKVTERMR